MISFIFYYVSAAGIFFNIDEWAQVVIASSLYISRSFSGKYVSYAKPVLIKDKEHSEDSL